ncbi:hypothetical protein H4R26_000398 [Coemansia thaxteri]|uniref:Extracellular metalloproteinase n=1 Tax=Coemansia thaxteri TaxID=2663907 RepID=A0A9W8EHY2_9FUNG|nr:hypothetical protein H4R26_000398 [Coemansia thaxteri]KAJ2487718.1 hypothetical protein EV174_000389 [Coemansia sp. RSA 2320]
MLLGLAWSADAMESVACNAPRPCRPIHEMWPKFNIYEQPVLVNTTQETSSLARRLALGQHGIPFDTIAVAGAYTDGTSGIAHVYAQQSINRKMVFSGLASVNINADGHVISSSQSFAPASAPLADAPAPSSRTNIARAASSRQAAPTSLSAYLGSGSDSVGTATEALVYAADGSVVPVWHISLRQGGHWWSACVNAHHGRVEALNDWAHQFSRAESFQVFPRTVLSPGDGPRRLVASPANAAASPRGWVATNTMAGNNVWAQNNPDGGYGWLANHRPTAANPTFAFPLDLTQPPSSYVDASVTQLFYTVNMMHDLSFIYGFDEAAGNFQDPAAALGEGWSDMVANLLRIRASDSPACRALAMGAYVYGRGIRKHPYSVDRADRAATYASLDTPAYRDAHAAGEVWAQILYDVTWRLTDRHGAADDLFLRDLATGSLLMLQIVLDAVKLQPCHPSFLDARDAIVHAERNLTGGRNRCTLWRGFAARGLGAAAAFDGRRRTEDFTLPPDCRAR